MQHSATSGAFLRGAATRAPSPPSPSAPGARGPCCAAAAQNNGPASEALGPASEALPVRAPGAHRTVPPRRRSRVPRARAGVRGGGGRPRGGPRGPGAARRMRRWGRAGAGCSWGSSPPAASQGGSGADGGRGFGCRVRVWVAVRAQSRRQPSAPPRPTPRVGPARRPRRRRTRAVGARRRGRRSGGRGAGARERLAALEARAEPGRDALGVEGVPCAARAGGVTRARLGAAAESGAGGGRAAGRAPHCISETHSSAQSSSRQIMHSVLNCGSSPRPAPAAPPSPPPPCSPPSSLPALVAARAGTKRFLGITASMAVSACTFIALPPAPPARPQSARPSNHPNPASSPAPPRYPAPPPSTLHPPPPQTRTCRQPGQSCPAPLLFATPRLPGGASRAALPLEPFDYQHRPARAPGSRGARRPAPGNLPLCAWLGHLGGGPVQLAGAGRGRPARAGLGICPVPQRLLLLLLLLPAAACRRRRSRRRRDALLVRLRRRPVREQLGGGSGLIQPRGQRERASCGRRAVRVAVRVPGGVIAEYDCRWGPHGHVEGHLNIEGGVRKRSCSARSALSCRTGAAGAAAGRGLRAPSALCLVHHFAAAPQLGRCCRGGRLRLTTAPLVIRLL